MFVVPCVCVEFQFLNDKVSDEKIGTEEKVVQKFMVEHPPRVLASQVSAFQV
jgi:hypothetical protein